MTYTILADSTDREAWLDARLTGVGASDTPALMGYTSYASALSLWALKTERVPSDDDAFDNERMRWGTKLEPLVAEEYDRQTGREVSHWGELLSYDEAPYILATPDYYYEVDGVRIPVEIKTTDVSRSADWAEGVPDRVNCQLQQQMLVTGAPYGSTGVLVGGNTFRWADVERDDAFIAEIERTCAEFWRYVETDESPPIDGSEATSEAIKKMWPRSAPGETIVLPDDAYDWARALADAKAETKEAKARQTEIENIIKAALGNNEIGMYPDGAVAFTYKSQTRKSYTVKDSSSRVLRAKS